jgi:hypothetical protein
MPHSTRRERRGDGTMAAERTAGQLAAPALRMQMADSRPLDASPAFGDMESRRDASNVAIALVRSRVSREGTNTIARRESFLPTAKRPSTELA